MRIMKTIAAGAALAAVASMATSASAATYISTLEYVANGGAAVTTGGPFGTVKLEELADGKSVKVTVTLANANSKFVNTGPKDPDSNSNKDPFLFGLSAASDVTVATAGFYSGPYNGSNSSSVSGPFEGTPFGTYTNRIGCCGDKNGGANGLGGPLVFTVYNAGGLTFAGVGATFGAGGKLVTAGSGNRFVSNTADQVSNFNGGWWFAADILDGATNGQTYTVAARDAFCQGAGCGGGGVDSVPEPGAWALMILGFGAAGATLRRRKALAA